MKRLALFCSVLMVVILLILTGCSGTSTPSTTTSQPAPATSTAQPATTTTTSKPATTPPPASPTPVYGGILRAITSGGFPSLLGLPTEFAPSDSIYALPVLERLCEWDAQGNQIPVLATSWEGDANAMTVTWHLRQGVKFTDGTDFNADAVKFNFQLGIDAGRLTEGQFVKSMDVLDPYTLRMNLTNYTSMMFEDYGWDQQISPTAFKNAGGGDIEKSKAWARTNSVGTGPFTVSSFTRDSVIKYTKNPNYWRTGMPYLDGMEVRLIPDQMTAAATLEAKQADIWLDTGAVQNIMDLQKKGLIDNQGPGYFFALLPNSSDPSSPTSKIEVRQAIEYAIDRPALANMIGFGRYEPLTQIAASKFPGYVAGYNPRPYDPAKAKQLLAAAGYPNGFKTKIMTTSTSTDAVAGIKAYLDAVGIQTEVDIADLGRYFGQVFGTGWTDDMVFAASGINPDATDLFIHFGPSPMTFKTKNIYKSPEYLAILNQALKTYNTADMIALFKKAVQQAGTDAMIIPIYRNVDDAVMQPYVHSDYYLIHGVIWHSYSQWMDKH
jgi:peptide/nickel transport system substrate-binding protein